MKATVLFAAAIPLLIYAPLSHCETKALAVFSSNPSAGVYYRIPSLVVVKKSGVIVAFAEERRGGPGLSSTSDTGDINVVARVSRDHGRTWGKKKIVCDSHWIQGANAGRHSTCGNPTPVVDQTTQQIHLFMSGNHGHKKQSDAVGDEKIGVGDRWVVYAKGSIGTAGQINFDRPVLANALQPAGFTWDAMGPGAGIQLTTGKHVGRLVVPATRRTIYSDDGGKSWHLSQTMTKGPSETAIAELNHGMIYRNDRNRGTLSPTTDHGYRVISFSADGGGSFIPPTLDTNLPDPLCQGSLLRYANEHILFANCASKTTRSNLTIRHSKDGLNWDSSKEIDSTCGYSSMAKTRDFNIAILYEKSVPGRRGFDLVFRKFKLYDIVK